MSASVFLADPADLDGISDEFVLRGDEGRHAVAVMRLGPGELVHVVDGAGRRLIGMVRETSGKDALVIAVERIEVVPEPQPRFVIVQALPKSEHSELAVDLLTQAGADVIVPWAARNCVTQWKTDRAEKAHAKWVATARTTSKQCRRSRIPEIAPLASLADVQRIVSEADLALLLHEDASTPISSIDLPGTGTIVLIIGPEGSIAPEERAALADATEVLLGPTVLRTSAAGAIALGALMSRTSRWDPAGMEGFRA